MTAEEQAALCQLESVCRAVLSQIELVLPSNGLITADSVRSMLRYALSPVEFARAKQTVNAIGGAA